MNEIRSQLRSVQADHFGSHFTCLTCCVTRCREISSPGQREHNIESPKESLHHCPPAGCKHRENMKRLLVWVRLCIDSRCIYGWDSVFLTRENYYNITSSDKLKLNNNLMQFFWTGFTLINTEKKESILW